MKMKAIDAVVLQTMVDREPTDLQDLQEQSGYADIYPSLRRLGASGCVVKSGSVRIINYKRGRCWYITERGRVALALWLAHDKIRRSRGPREMDIAWDAYFLYPQMEPAAYA